MHQNLSFRHSPHLRHTSEESTEHFGDRSSFTCRCPDSTDSYPLVMDTRLLLSDMMATLPSAGSALFIVRCRSHYHTFYQSRSHDLPFYSITRRTERQTNLHLVSTSTLEGSSLVKTAIASAELTIGANQKNPSIGFT